jgi:Leucine-rich repeat (LRR) protein
MEQVELEQIIKRARGKQLSKLVLSNNQISILQESIFTLCDLSCLVLSANIISHLPENIDNLFNLTDLNLSKNHIQIRSQFISRSNSLDYQNLLRSNPKSGIN